MELITEQPEYLKEIDPEFDLAFEVSKHYNHVHFLHFDGIGVFVCIDKGDTISGHPLIHEKARGKAAITAGKEAIKYWQDKGKHIQTRCNKALKHARWYNRQIGLNPYYEDDEFIYYEVPR